jgi:PTH1 family peptidyl-tRNA hydrolase
MKIIVGLGNPGEKYKNTRHNLGFMVVDEAARKFLPLKETKWEEDKQANALVLRLPPNILLVKPLTFMNASGKAVVKLASSFKLQASSIWVVHDDIDLPLGKIKIRLGGGSAGHRGIESIIKELGTDKFVRFRLGIGHPGRGKDDAVEKYVLREFDINERSEVEKMIKKTVKAIQVALEKGPEKAMSKFNA